MAQSLISGLQKMNSMNSFETVNFEDVSNEVYYASPDKLIYITVFKSL